MQFNSNADGQDIVTKTLWLTGTTITSYTAKEIASNSNEALSRMALITLASCGRMQWDDVNHGNQPIATFNLENGVGSYTIFKAIPTATQDWLEVERVEILDESDNGVQLTPIDHQDVQGAMSELLTVDSTPRYFEINGNEIKFYPEPDYDKTAGCTIYFKRAPSYYASTDTTKEPGFASIFDDYIPKYNAMMWFFAHDMLSRYDRLRLELKGNDPRRLGGMELAISDFYRSRAKYERPKITRRKQHFI